VTDGSNELPVVKDIVGVGDFKYVMRVWPCSACEEEQNNAKQVTKVTKMPHVSVPACVVRV